MAKFDLTNKLAIITGAASGIGLATARLFATEGADLALVDISPRLGDVAAQLRQHHTARNISAHVIDLTESSQVEQLFDKIQAQHEKFRYASILVNSAGIGQGKSFTEISEQDYDRMIRVNIKGTFLITQVFVKRLVENFASVKFSSGTESYASIVNLGSRAGKYGGPGYTHYSITKAGVDALSKSLAKEYGSMRIRCNCILPFFVETPLADELIVDEERRAFFKGLNALKRFGQPEEVAQLILFLASDASSFITGASIDINGGY